MTSEKISIEVSTCCGKTRRGRPLQMESTAREAAILRTTAQLLLEVPFDDLTMTAIAGKAGMSKRTVYEHFKSREDLLVRAIMKLTSTIFLPLSEDDTHRPLRERLSLLLRFNVPPGSEAAKLEFLRSVIAKAQTYPVLAEELHTSARGVLAGFVRAEISRGIDCGEIVVPPKDVKLAVDMLLNMAFENTLTRLLHPGSPPQDEAEVERRRMLAITVFLRGFAP